MIALSHRPEDSDDVSDVRHAGGVALPVADEPWYKDGLKFRCSTCGNCCTGPAGYVWVTDDEVEELATLLKMSEPDFRRKHVRKIGKRLSLKEVRQPNGQYDCEFLKPLKGDKPDARKRGCKVYKARPLQCRTWPFWQGLLQSEEAWNHGKTMCPGMDKPDGKLYGVKEIRDISRSDAWPDKPPSSK